jgi:hypothetical protein
MLRKTKLLYFFVLIALVFNCRPVTSEARKVTEEKKVSDEDYAYYKAVRYGTPEEMEDFLKSGHDPNYMQGLNSIDWFETNPLWSLGLDDVGYEKTEILIRYGANTANRGYPARILASANILSESLKEEMRQNYYGDIPAMFDDAFKSEESIFRVVKLYLDNGYKPNLKAMGALDYDIMKITPRNDETMNAYFETHGITALNAAIAKNLFTIVDLLLDNGALLDGDSLSYAQQATVNCGGNTLMEHKIRALLSPNIR